MASIAGFIDEIRDNLSDHAYTSFKTALAAYKKVHSIVCSISTLALSVNEYLPNCRSRIFMHSLRVLRTYSSKHHTTNC